MTAPTSPLAAGLAALCATARTHNVFADPATLAREIWLPANEALDPEILVRAARHLGLRAQWTSIFVDHLVQAPFPALALLESANGTLRSVIVTGCDGKRVQFQDEAEGNPRGTFVQEFDRQWTGELLLFNRAAIPRRASARFNLSRFVPRFAKRSKLLDRRDRLLSK